MNEPRPRRIYVDQSHVRGHITGIERVALDLFAPERLAPHEVVPFRSGGVPRMILDQQLTLPAKALAERDALFIYPGFPPGPLSALMGERCLFYVHDTFLLSRPQDLNWKSRAYMTPGFALAMRYARRIFTNSFTTGADIRRYCSPDAMVALLRPAVADVFGLAGSSGAAPYREGEPLRILAIGTIEPRKDYPASIALVDALNRAGIPAELHIVGRVGWGRHDFLASPPPFLTVHGYIGDDALRRLAETCHLLLSTSKAEGLGLPLLEVQHGGLPVVAPEADIFAEVLGASALFIRPGEPEAAARAVAEAARSGDLARRAALSRPNVTQWNALCAADAGRFRDFVRSGPSAYGPENLVPAL
ncbi:glycosyltransferase [Methylobacterium sp. sgz302541]|uniref:glycosyltransferase n=1 Tax=unclassified Methylobacterium TaxID=2615210 RepID=UPI003D33274D